MPNIDSYYDFVNKTVEEQINTLPLCVYRIDTPNKKYCFSLFRHTDGEYLAQYEIFDSNELLYQVNDYSLKKCLEKLYLKICRDEDLFFINQ